MSDLYKLQLLNNLNFVVEQKSKIIPKLSIEIIIILVKTYVRTRETDMAKFDLIGFEIDGVSIFLFNIIQECSKTHSIVKNYLTDILKKLDVSNKDNVIQDVKIKKITKNQKEEIKILNHTKLQAIISKFWAMLTRDEYGRIDKEQYAAIMRRIYKVLLPYYNKKDVDQAINDEWIFDCGGRSNLDFNLFAHVIFRVAHWWCTHIDYEEYAFFLTKVFERVICKVIVSKNQRDKVLPHIVVSFPEEEKAMQKSEEDKDEDAEGEDDGPDWIECDEDESPRSDYEYKYGDDNDAMDLKRYKRPKKGSGAQMLSTTHVKEPFLYREEVEFVFENLTEGQAVIDQLIGEEYVLPFGYPTEQLFYIIKNDVAVEFDAYKERHKLSGDDDLKDFIDRGEVKPDNNVINTPFSIHSNNGFHKEIKFSAKILDYLFNKLRFIMRECLECSIRLNPEYPNVNLRSSSIARQSDDVPVTEISKVGNNPLLDCRICFEKHYIPSEKDHYYINQFYMIDHIDLKYAFKTKISKIENKKHLVMKEEDGIRREEDFIPCETDYRTMIQFMLNRKFESFYGVRQKLEEKEQQRLKKMKEREAKRTREAGPEKKVDTAPDVRIEQQNKLISAFHHLISKEGVIKDPFVNRNDLIVEANKPAVSILILGKPRSGKSKLCELLSKSLDIVHINVKNYIDKLLKKVAEYEPPEVEEGQEPPKFLTDVEEEVQKVLKEGLGPNDDLIVSMLAERISSSEAQSKGFILDLPYHQRHESWYDTMNRGSFGIMPNDFSYIIELMMSDSDVKIRAQGIRFDPETGEIVSKWEREQRRKPKKVKKRGDEEAEGEEDQEEEDEPEDPDDPDAPKKPKILQKDQVLVRIRDLDDQIDNELTNFATVRPAFQSMIDALYHHQYIQFDCAGCTPETICSSMVVRIKGENTLLRPLAIPLESESSGKAYLTSNKEEGELPRRWSLWKQIDPVALSKGRVVEGQAEFGASYNDRVFLFETEENLKEF